MTVQKFPCFENLYEGTRGRQTLCKQEQQRSENLIYNDTLKRIICSKGNAEELKKLAKKYEKNKLGYKKIKKIEKFQRNNLKEFNNNNSSSHNNNSNNSKYNLFSRQQRKRSLGKLESVDNDLRQQQQQQFPLNLQNSEIRAACYGNGAASNARHHRYLKNCGITEQEGAETLTYYLQLATDYYEQGFLKNIKYLENVGERNHYRRKRQLQLKQQQQHLPQQKPLSSNLAKSANILTTKSFSLQTETQLTDAKNNVIKQHIKPTTIYNNNSIDLAKHQEITNDNLTLIEEYPLLAKVTEKNCAIRVNIKPQTCFNAVKRASSTTGNFFNITQEIYGIQKVHNNSMNDYLNGNYQQQQQQQHQQQQLINEQHYHQQQQLATTAATLSVNNFPTNIVLIDNLIDNLRDLDLQENHLNLPKITLTDCSHNFPTEIYNNYQSNNIEKQKKSIILKQSKFDKSNLEIPLEQDLYHSEARPP